MYIYNICTYVVPYHANALLTDARNLRKKLKCQENFVRKCRNNLGDSARGHATDLTARSQGGPPS